MSLPHHLEALLSSQAYPHPVRTVDLVETHISWLLLTGDLAYKVKRPVALPFVDMRSSARREFLCHEEVRLNRRFAPELYLGISRITAGPEGAAIDGEGPVIEHAVRMHQFDRREELDVLLESHAVMPGELAQFGHELACIHSSLPRAAPDAAWGRPGVVRAALLRNFEQTLQVTGDFIDTGPLQSLRGPLERKLDAASSWMNERRAAGSIRECHGDLHCGNLVRIRSRLLAFDCLEFDRALRWIDIADEVAFLMADLQSRGRPAHAEAFLGGYLQRSGDYHACRFLELYKAHRSLVRAKVAVLGAMGSADGQARASARRRYHACIDCAHASLSPKHPVLILMSGLSGSGKTWLASRIAPPFGGVHIRSDIERKRLAGLSPSQRSESEVGAGLYSSEMNARVHRRMLAAAESTLAGGYTTVVDATFSIREDRRQFSELASRLGVPACLVHCQAPAEVLRSRIEERTKDSSDPSEADLAVLDWQRRHYEPVGADEPFHVLEASTDEPSALNRLKRLICAAGCSAN